MVDFAPNIDEESYDVLTPKVSDTIAAIQTSVKPWVLHVAHVVECGSITLMMNSNVTNIRDVITVVAT